MKNLPIDLLRTFITIDDLGGFTQAGELLGRSQPAISLQLKRLEDILGLKLFNRSGGLELTEDGHLLSSTAKKILEINDAYISRLSNPSVCGTVRLGIPNDFEVSFLPVLLAKFSRAYPQVTLEVISDVSITLREEYKKGSYELVMSMDEYPKHCFSENDYIIEPLSWVSSPNYTMEKNQPVPLVVYPQGCIYRHHITNALNKAGVPWRILYCSSSLLGIHSAIKSGLGISAMVANTIPSEFQSTDLNAILPDLGKITIGFNYDQHNLSAAAALLLNYLRQGLVQNKNFPASFKVE